MFEKRKKEIAARRAEIRALLEKATDEEMNALERELDDLDAEEAMIARKEAATERLNRSAGSADPASAPAHEGVHTGGQFRR